jgi:heterodisulfide reductase subunit A-like polyferredoxin
VDPANEGEYLAGLAHSPRFIDETIAHAKAVAGRAATILSRAKLDIAGQVANVDPEGCVACACPPQKLHATVIRENLIRTGNREHSGPG